MLKQLLNLQAVTQLTERLAQSEQQRGNLQARLRALVALLATKDQVIAANVRTIENINKVDFWPQLAVLLLVDSLQLLVLANGVTSRGVWLLQHYAAVC